jgi:hypothetical protein
MLVHSYLRKNLLSGKFNEMGMATAVGPNDGKVYLVQYFRSVNPSNVLPKGAMEFGRMRTM